jgi:4-hydroxy-tetrahydrodipicolinate synthase
MFSGSIVALITPFTQNNQIDYDCVSELIEWHIASGTQGLVIAGTTGESATISDQEKVALVTFVVKKVNHRITVIAGNGSNNTAQSVELTKALNHTGIDGFLTVTPYYNKPTEAGLFAHYSTIAAATELPIILYNVPSRTQCDLSNTLVQKLSELNNIKGLKDATADLSRLSWLKQACDDSFMFFSGDDATAMAYCMSGGQGVISVTGNVIPTLIAELQQLIHSKQYTEAQLLEQRLSILHKALFVESNPIAVKWALYKLNKIPNANLRLPLTTLSEQGQHFINQTILDSGLFA